MEEHGRPQELVLRYRVGTPLREIIKLVIRQVVEACGGNKAKASRRLDCSAVMIANRVKNNELNNRIVASLND